MAKALYDNLSYKHSTLHREKKAREIFGGGLISFPVGVMMGSRLRIRARVETNGSIGKQAQQPGSMPPYHGGVVSATLSQIFSLYL